VTWTSSIAGERFTVRILVLGAGGIGGYFGGRLLQAGRDVTFLVRARRAAQLRKTGLVIRSPAGDAQLPNPPMVLADRVQEPFDLILLSCKAYDLEAAVRAIGPAVGPNTKILPLLNGMRHLEVLEAQFGKDAVLGGQCFISVALDAEGHVVHFNPSHTITFGERGGAPTHVGESIRDVLCGAGFDVLLSSAIVQEMWEKWIFIASMAGLTCLMRASIGDVMVAAGPGIATALYAECAEVARSAGFAPSPTAVQRTEAFLTNRESELMASMLRDIERGAQTEGEHILGDLVRRRVGSAPAVSLLALAYAHVKAYETRRARTILAN
jgi:2-dehydropantoate 2-reductase